MTQTPLTYTPLPQQINYGQFRPKGYYTQFKQWAITPLSSNQYWNSDQLVRFLVTIKEGVMDPYRSHIEFNVNTTASQLPVGGVQVDNSAQSFIAQSVISSNNVEIERIAQYDTLAAYLTDIGFSQYVCQSRSSQGLGYSNTSTHAPWSTTHSYGSQVSFNWTGSDLQTQSVQTGLILPTSVGSWTGRGNNALSTASSQYMTPVQVMGNTTVAPSNCNILWQGPGQELDLDQVRTQLGRFNNARGQYMTSILARNYPDTPSSILQTTPIIKNQTYTTAQMTNISATSGFNPKAPYQIGYTPSNKVYSYINGSEVVTDLPMQCSVYGFQKPISSQFCRGTNQTMLSPTIPQCQMQNGVILPQKIPVSQAVFRIPLISSICGVLIPVDQFLLIPMKALYNLLIQLTLSRFAMFTTGYNDVHQMDLVGMQNMQKRAWNLSNIQWNLHLYTFPDSYVRGQIEASLVKQIPVTTTMYSLASQFQMPNGSFVRNTWNIGTQAQSLCQIICLFISNQYQQHSFCRKQFRLSNNITSMQIKFNADFYPTQPIIGNAGNPQYLDTTGDNYPFYKQILLSNNYLFNTNFPHPKINVKNFAVNKRCYDITNTSTFYDVAMRGNMGYQWTNKSVNCDTALGCAHFHQNRYIGKAAFVYSWQPYGHSKNYMTGINASGVQNFGVIFNNLSTQTFPSDQTLMIFARQNALVIYGQDGVKILGK